MRAILVLLWGCTSAALCTAQTLPIQFSYKQADTAVYFRFTAEPGFDFDACHITMKLNDNASPEDIKSAMHTVKQDSKSTLSGMQGKPIAAFIVSKSESDASQKQVQLFDLPKQQPCVAMQYITMYKMQQRQQMLCTDNFFGAQDDSIWVQFATDPLPEKSTCIVQLMPKHKNNVLYANDSYVLEKGKSQFLLPIPINNLPNGYFNLRLSLLRADTVAEHNVYEIQKIQSKNFWTKAAVAQYANDTTRQTILPKNSWLLKYTPVQIYRNATAMSPLLNRTQLSAVEDLVATKNDSLLRNFMYNYWADINPSNPELAWQAYAKQLNFVAKNYANSGLTGFETDRGRVYLRYGPPIQLERILNEKDALPYEVWIYPSIGAYNDVYFIFFQLGRMAGDFRLLHSNLPGEMFNQNWRTALFKDPSDQNHRVYEWINLGGR